MALQGTIDSFPLTDVLRLLAASSKSGRLVVNGDRGHGQVWLAAGAVTGGETTQVLAGGDPTEVVFDLLRYATGSFIFEADAANPSPSASLPVDYVLTQSEAALAEWRELAEVVPSGNAWLVLNAVLPQPEVVIDQALWSHLVVIAPGLDVNAFGRALVVGEVATLRLVRDLIASGMVAVGERPEPAVLLDQARTALSGDDDGTDQLVAEVPWDQWNAEVFEPSGADDDPSLDGPERDLFGAFDPFAAESSSRQTGDGVPPVERAAFDGAAFDAGPVDSGHTDSGPIDQAAGGAFEEPTHDRAAYDSAGFDSAAYDSAGFDSAAYDSAAYDSAGFESPAFESAAFERSAFDAPTTDSSTAFEMGAPRIEANAPVPTAEVPTPPLTPAAPISHAVDPSDQDDPADMGDDVIRQMAMLSPKAAQAVATAMSGQGPVSSDALPDSDEERDRLLKFLGSV